MLPFSEKFKKIVPGRQWKGLFQGEKYGQNRDSNWKMMVLRFIRNNLGSKRKRKKPGSLLSFQGNFIAKKKKKIPRLACYNLWELIHSFPKHTLNPKSAPAEADREGNEAPRSRSSSAHPDVAMEVERQGRTWEGRAVNTKDLYVR